MGGFSPPGGVTPVIIDVRPPVVFARIAASSAAVRVVCNTFSVSAKSFKVFHISLILSCITALSFVINATSLAAVPSAFAALLSGPKLFAKLNAF